MQTVKRIIKSKVSDCDVTFEIEELDPTTRNWSVVRTLVGEFEITDDNTHIYDDQYRAYLSNAQMMLYIVFEDASDDHLSRFYKNVALALFAKENDITRAF